MRLVVGHANPDFDAYASSVAAARLFGDATAVYLGSQNANVRSFHNLHEDLLPFADLKSLDLDGVTDVVMVDTRDPDRIGELAEVVTRPGVCVVVYDHHPPQEGDVTGADDRSLDVGATTSILVHELRRAGMAPSPLEASLYLLGIHEDTGSLTYPTTTALDAEAVAWLMESGADMEVLNQYLNRALSPAQRALLSQIESSIEVWDVNGQRIAVGTAVAPEYVDSASVLTHYVVEEMGYRVAIGVIAMPGRTQVVARSRVAEVDVGAALALVGGGGHAQAASAGFRDVSMEAALERVHSALSATVRPPVNAGQLMSAPVRTIEPAVTMEQAAAVLSRWGHGGMPVVEGGVLVGLVTRKDVDKAMRHGLGHAPVKGFMRRDVVTVERDAGLSDLESILGTRGIGRVPVVEGRCIIGIVTRKDVLRARHGSGYLGAPVSGGHHEDRTAFLRGVEELLPSDARAALHLMGAIAESLNVRAHVVGGFVRDMILGRANLDIDVVVEGDGIVFAEAVGSRLGARVTAHRRFGTAVIVVSRDLHIDVASSRAEYYTRPGALPTVELSSLRQDLFRRDFTINAMAASLAPGGFGTISDPFGGLADLHAGRLRVLHALSFVDDPTRLMRAARFEVRYGFELDPHALQLAAQAAEMDLLAEVSGARLREELLDILDEDEPGRVLGRLQALGALSAVLPAGVSAPRAVTLAEDVLEALRRLQALGLRGASRRSVFLAALAAQSTVAEGERWIRHVRIGRAHAAAVRSVIAAQAQMAVLRSMRPLRDVRLYHLLIDAQPAALVCLWALGDEITRGRIEHFVHDLLSIRPSVSGEDLIAMGARPGAAFSAILARCLDDVLDGRVVGREAELANLRRRALDEGLLPPRKDGS